MKYYDPQNLLTNMTNLTTYDFTDVRDGLTMPAEFSENIVIGISPRADHRQIFKLKYLPSKLFPVNVLIGSDALTVGGWRFDIPPAVGFAGISFERGLLEVPINATGTITIEYHAGATYADAGWYKNITLQAYNTQNHLTATNPHGISILNLTNGAFAFENGIIVDKMGGGISISPDGMIGADEVTASSFNGTLNGTWSGINKSNLQSILSGVSIGTTGYANGKITKIEVLPSTNTYGKSILDGASFMQTPHGITNYDTSMSIYYTQKCSIGGMPQIFRKTPTDAAPVDMGEVLTDRKFYMILTGGLNISGLGTTEVYVNPFNVNRSWSSVAVKPDNSFYQLDQIATASPASGDTFPKTAAVSVGDKRVKILQAGRYKISGWARYQGGTATNANYTLRVLKNRSIRDWWDGSRVYAGYPCIMLNMYLDCAAGDYIHLDFSNGTLDSLVYILASLEIEKIS